jgi:hypothetical protein
MVKSILLSDEEWRLIADARQRSQRTTNSMKMAAMRQVSQGL